MKWCRKGHPSFMQTAQTHCSTVRYRQLQITLLSVQNSIRTKNQTMAAHTQIYQWKTFQLRIVCTFLVLMFRRSFGRASLFSREALPIFTRTQTFPGAIPVGFVVGRTALHAFGLEYLEIFPSVITLTRLQLRFARVG